MDVSIIIVNYNTKNLLFDCLSSIYEKTIDISFEVIVSDNGSQDGSIEMIETNFPQVVLVQNNENLGFGAANNKGLELAKGKYVFYLNSDTILLNNAVKIFFDYFEVCEDNVGALGCNLLSMDGKNIISFADFPIAKKEYKYLINCFFSSLGIKKVVYKFKKNRVRAKYIGPVDYIIGADLFLRNNADAKFDERFFMYYEETDLQLNMKKKGLDRIIIDGPQIIHLEGGSSLKKDNHMYSFKSKTSHYYWQSCIQYFEKNLVDSKLIKNRIESMLDFIYRLPWNK